MNQLCSSIPGSVKQINYEFISISSKPKDYSFVTKQLQLLFQKKESEVLAVSRLYALVKDLH
jgi:hypothetical protein